MIPFYLFRGTNQNYSDHSNPGNRPTHSGRHSEIYRDQKKEDDDDDEKKKNKKRKKEEEKKKTKKKKSKEKKKKWRQSVT